MQPGPLELTVGAVSTMENASKSGRWIVEMGPHSPSTE